MVCILFSARLVSGSFPLLCEQWEMAGDGHDGRQRVATPAILGLFGKGFLSSCWAWENTLVIPALGSLRQEDVRVEEFGLHFETLSKIEMSWPTVPK